MSLFLIILFIVIGFAILIGGADWLVSGASSLARRYNISELVIGLTIVAFGTSAPEMVVNVVASAEARSDIVLGNIIGSNIFNLFVILGIAGIIFPIRVQSSTAWREVPLSIIITLLLLLLANDFFLGSNPQVSRLDGFILLALFGGFVWYVFTQLKKEPEQQNLPENRPVWKIWVMILAGLAGLVFGGRLVVDHSVELARTLGLSEKVIGLTVLAAGTSLPELVTSVVAALKKKNDIAIGNVIGSNIFNMLLILGVSALIRPVIFNYKFNTELIFLFAGTLLLFIAMMTGQRKQLDRWEALVLLILFTAYTVILIRGEILTG